MKKILISLFIFFSFFGFAFSNYKLSENVNIFSNPANNVIYCSWDKDCGLEKWIEKTKVINSIEKDADAASYAQRVVVYVLWFLFFVTVLIIIWAGAVILTSAWNDDKIEKAKKIIMNCIIWIIVIFLAYPITSFVVWVFDKAKTTQN